MINTSFKKECKGLSWASMYQHVVQSRRNEKIPLVIQPMKTEFGGNRTVK
jgi:hypothetical protein